MARLKKKVLGQVSGAVGDIVFRERYGNNYVGMRPDSFIPGTSPADYQRRQRFALAAKTGITINSVAQLKMLWKGATPSGLSSFNYVVKINYPFVTSTDLTNLLQLVPGNGFGVTIEDNNTDRVRVHVLFDPIGTNAGINTALEPNIMMAGVIFLTSPVDQSVGAYSILSVASPTQATDLVQQLTFDANLTSQQQQVFDKYQTTKTFVALITLDAVGNPVHFSSTALLQ
jgi:hypothetical protein